MPPRINTGSVSPRPSKSSAVGQDLYCDLPAIKDKGAGEHDFASGEVSAQRCDLACESAESHSAGSVNTSPEKMSWSPGPGPEGPRSRLVCWVSWLKSRRVVTVSAAAFIGQHI